MSQHPQNSEPVVQPPSTLANSLPAEIWLEILELIGDAEELWVNVRLVSRRHRALVERAFRSKVLPLTAISLSLPRRDPSTNTLKYPGAVPLVEMTFTFSNLDATMSNLVLASPTNLRGTSVREMKQTGVLPLQRLEEAAMWVWIGTGSSKGKGITMNMPVGERQITWDDAEGVWKWETDWKKFITAYIAKKTRLRRVMQKKKAERLEGGMRSWQVAGRGKRTWY